VGFILHHGNSRPVVRMITMRHGIIGMQLVSRQTKFKLVKISWAVNFERIIYWGARGGGCG
jgi:hypothetical protein